jgi:hypothetical protein
MLARMEANRESDREELKGMMNATRGSVDANLKDLKEDIKASQAEMRSIICTFRSELKETIQRKMRSILDAWLTDLKVGRKETTACQEATEIEPGPGMMQSVEELQEIRKEDAAVTPVEGPRKRRRVCNLAAKRRQKMRERTRGNSGSRRKVSRRAKVT